MMVVFYNYRNKPFNGRPTSRIGVPIFLFKFVIFITCAICPGSSIAKKRAMPSPKVMHSIPLRLLNYFLLKVFPLNPILQIDVGLLNYF